MIINKSAIIKNWFANSEKTISAIVPFCLFLFGIYYVPIRIMGFDFSHIPGDLGDARFNMFIMEHVYLWLTGSVDSLWNTPMMYPIENTLAFSDNHFGTVPFYALYRLVGFEYHTAFQLWILTMFILNFWICYISINKLFDNKLVSATAAYIFAFGLFNIHQMAHVQVLCRFMIPLCFYFWITFVKGKKPNALYAAVALVYIFYCAFYLGFYTLLGLLVATISYLLFFAKDFFCSYDLKSISRTFLLIFLVSLLLVPLVLPYIQAKEQFGLRQFSNIVENIPKPSSWVFCPPASIIWSSILHFPLKDNFTEWWKHSLFSGLLPYLIITVFTCFKKIKNQKLGREYWFYVTFFLLFTTSVTNFNGYSIYEYIARLPGFLSMRAVNRVVNIQVFALIMLMVYSAYSISSKNGFHKIILMILPFLVIIDNTFEVKWRSKRFKKSVSIEEIYKVKQNIRKHKLINYEAIAYKVPPKNKNVSYKLNHHLSVLLACQELELKTVNAFTGNYPDEFRWFLHDQSKESLTHFYKSINYSTNKVLFINGTGTKN